MLMNVVTFSILNILHKYYITFKVPCRVQYTKLFVVWSFSNEMVLLKNENK